jgi:hypothetical protein
VDFKLIIHCNTPAFGDRPELHLADILRGIANTVQHVGTLALERPVKTPVTDVNGIQCGAWSLVREKVKENK